MSEQITTTDGPDVSFPADASLTKADHDALVSLTADGKAKRAASTVAIGTLRQIDPDTGVARVRLLRAGGTVRGLAGAAIAAGAAVFATATGTLTGTAGSAELATRIGVKVTPGTCAAGDVIEFI
ncbi:MAG: hypothetical protein LBC18_08280 [Opitutaceae bacterium]|jgi:hypothetical protein|nr:hypothetical protein [Opitutaceae bacterium]